MKLLLDTHVMFWWLRDSPRLASRTKALIADNKADLMVSVASFWELSIKAGLGKAPENGSKLYAEASRGGLRIVDLSERHLATLEVFPFLAEHKDPFDRLILAQAIAEDAMLITGDRKMLGYDVRAFRAG